MTCGQLDQLVCDFIAGELPRARKLAVQRHLSVCANCADEVSSYLRTIALARDSMTIAFDSNQSGELVLLALQAVEEL